MADLAVLLVGWNIGGETSLLSSGFISTPLCCVLIALGDESFLCLVILTAISPSSVCETAGDISEALAGSY